MTEIEDPGNRQWPERIGGRRIDRGLLSGDRTTRRPAKVTTFQADVLVAQPSEKVFDFCLAAESFAKIMPNRITFLARTTEDDREGSIYVFRWWMVNVIPVTWVALIDRYVPGREFVDLQLRGIFRYFRHTHQCRPEKSATRYRDVIEFATAFGARVDRLVVLPLLQRMFRHRHRRMRQLLGAGES